jgi:large subunit ribosomal protein L15
MKQNELRPSLGSRHRDKRVGRGDASGHGSFSGRGIKGQKSRSGGGVRLGFEGGQLPLIKKLPKRRGFSSPFRVEYNIVNVGELNLFQSESEIGPKELFEVGLIKSPAMPTKILGDGDISTPLSVYAEKFSASAEKKIVAAGGKVQKG